LGIGVVASIFLSAHLVDVLALVVGFHPWTVLLAAWILLAATLALVKVDLRWLAAAPSLDGLAGRCREALSQYRGVWFLAAASGATVFGILFVGAWHDTSHGWIAGGWNWSDLLVHASIGQSLINGNFPPQVPYFAGVPLTYHWFGDFHAAILASVANVDLLAVFFISNGILAASFVLLVWELARRMTGERRIAYIAAILALFGGGMGWIRLPGDLMAGNLIDGKGDFLTLITNNPYDNTWAGGWPFFKIASVLGTGFEPHRATAYGLPGLIAILLLVQASFGRYRAAMLTAGVLAALLAPFHFFFFPATYLIVGLFWLTSMRLPARSREAVLGPIRQGRLPGLKSVLTIPDDWRPGRWRADLSAARAWLLRSWPADMILFMAPAVLAVPFIAPAIFQQGAQGSFRLVIGWSEAPLEAGPAAVAFFYVTNLGLPLLLALVAAFWPKLPYRGWLFTWALALFLVPNFVVASSVVFDMNKYFQVMWIAMAIMAAWLIRRWPRPIIAAVLLFCSISPALVSFWSMTSPTYAMSNGQEQASHWIAANTPELSVFVTDAYIDSPVDLAGRLRLTTFGPYAANLGYNPDQRAADVHSIYCDGPETAKSLMDRYKATYVLSSGGLLDCNGHAPTDFTTSALFRRVYAVNGVEIWHLLPPAPGE
jgi:hypothetical protein